MLGGDKVGRGYDAAEVALLRERQAERVASDESGAGGAVRWADGGCGGWASGGADCVERW